MSIIKIITIRKKKRYNILYFFELLKVLNDNIIGSFRKKKLLNKYKVNNC